jgi:hypothetical protein
MRFGSVCSGIEAASVAWSPLGWSPAWFSEIDSFPSAVLAHHYPDVPNFGDMTQLPNRIANGEVEAPDLFCGGTPCQAFSVAGMRKSLNDARGNLSLVFCEIANAIDAARHARGGGNPPSYSGKTSQGFSAPKTMPSAVFLQGLPAKMTHSSRQGKNGRTLVLCMAPKEQLHGAFLTPNISEWPNDAVVCSLSQVLEQTSIPQRFFLSSMACAGILRRAEKRGKKLPSALHEALHSVSILKPKTL